MGEKTFSIPKPTCKVPLSVDRCGIMLGRTVSISCVSVQRCDMFYCGPSNGADFTAIPAPPRLLALCHAKAKFPPHAPAFGGGFPGVFGCAEHCHPCG